MRKSKRRLIALSHAAQTHAGNSSAAIVNAAKSYENYLKGK